MKEGTQNEVGARGATAQPNLAARPGVIQRKCACGRSAGVSGDCEECQGKGLSLQRYSRGRSTWGGLLTSFNSSLPSNPPLDNQITSSNVLGHNLGRVSRGVQTKPASGQPGQPGEPGRDAKGTTTPTGKQQLAAFSDSESLIQRAVKGESDPSDTAAASDSPAATPPAASGPQAAEPAPSAETEVSTSLIVADTAREVAPNQMRQSEFLDQLRDEVCAAADAELAAVGQSTDGCPYLERWIGYYRTRSSDQAEKALRRYAPEAANVSSARDYVPLVAARVQRAVAVWARTGQITGVPDELVSELSGAGMLGGLSDLLSGAAGAVAGLMGMGGAFGKVFAKGRKGGAKETNNPREIRAGLSAGQSLDGGVRTRMESVFGHDFSGVRVHTDSNAAALSSSLNARAFTIGGDVAFGTGEYQPGTLIGDALIAHELAHVVQQSGSGTDPASMQRGNAENQALEEDADTSAIGAMASLLDGGKRAAGNVAGKAIPRLKSGLGLSRCKTDGPEKEKKPAPIITRTLTKKAVPGGYVEGNCGEYSWTIQWEIDKAAGTSGGFVVQGLTVEYNVTDCAGKAVNVHNETLQEAWPINAGKLVSKWAEGGDLNDDTYTDPSSGKKTKGYIKVVATAAYYDGITLPSDFKVNNPKTQSGILPSTDTIHKLAGGTAEIPHDLTASWDCCPDKTDKTKIVKT